MSISATGGSLPYSYSWVTLAGPDQVPTPTASSNLFIPSGSGTFVVTVREGCGDTEEDTIHISVDNCDVIPPNVFTPNGDGTNDQLVFNGLLDFPGSPLTVYNRWGGKVYESSDYRNDWDGSGLSEGTYYYILNISNGETLTGFVMLLMNK
jgi:gliding motility-associated-like protein